MTDEIAFAIDNAKTLTEIEDIYRPYRPKRKTRASVAKEKGLEPLAQKIYLQLDGFDPYDEAKNFITDEVETVEDAIDGARDIIAEMVSDDAQGRKQLRYVCRKHGSKIANHRVLAINRAEKEDFLKVSLDFDKANGVNVLKGLHVTAANPSSDIVFEAVDDAYSRLIFPAIEREIRNELTDRASEDSIKVFAKNTAELLMQPPVKGRVTIGLDPGYRTGCKVAVVDETGKVLDTAVIYCAPPHSKIDEAKKIIKNLVQKYNVKMFAIGNGTATHETEVFAAEVIKELDCGITYMVVSEAGASVYSASKLAAEEFPPCGSFNCKAFTGSFGRTC